MSTLREATLRALEPIHSDDRPLLTALADCVEALEFEIQIQAMSPTSREKLAALKAQLGEK